MCKYTKELSFFFIYGSFIEYLSISILSSVPFTNLSIKLYLLMYLLVCLSVCYPPLSPSLRLSSNISESYLPPSTHLLLSFKLRTLSLSHTLDVPRSIHTNYLFLFMVLSANPKAAPEYLRLTRSYQKDVFQWIPSELFTFLKLCKSCPGGMLNPAKCTRL